MEYIQNYLVYDKETDTFSPNFQEYEADIRQLYPVLLICYEAITQFVSSFQESGLPPSLLDELANDEEIISALDRMHHVFYIDE